MRTALLAVALLAPLVAAAQGADPRADFTVAVQTPDGQPVPGATVLVGTDLGAAADADGQAVFEDVAPGRYAVRVSFVGSPPVELDVELTGSGPWALVVDLEDATGLLGGVVVEGDRLDRSRMARDGFFRRQRAGFGTVLTAEDIERRGATVLSSALRGVLGVRPLRGRTGGAVVTSTRGGCRMGVYLDGSFAPDLTDDLDALPLQDVAAVEVYNGLQVPVQYRTPGQVGGACGVVLVWTRFSALNPR